jgi:hypothetical protein
MSEEISHFEVEPTSAASSSDEEEDFSQVEDF